MFGTLFLLLGCYTQLWWGLARSYWNSLGHVQWISLLFSFFSFFLKRNRRVDRGRGRGTKRKRDWDRGREEKLWSGCRDVMYERIQFFLKKKMFALTFMTLITRQNYNKFPMVNNKKEKKRKMCLWCSCYFLNEITKSVCVWCILEMVTFLSMWHC